MANRSGSKVEGKSLGTKAWKLDLLDEKQMQWAREFIPSDLEHKKTSQTLGARVYWEYLKDSSCAVEVGGENCCYGGEVYKIHMLPKLPEKYNQDFWINSSDVRKGYAIFRERLIRYMKFRRKVAEDKIGREEVEESEFEDEEEKRCRNKDKGNLVNNIIIDMLIGGCEKFKKLMAYEKFAINKGITIGEDC